MERLKKALEEAHIPFAAEEPMAKHTTLRLGGPSDLFCTPRSEEAVRTVLRLVREEKVPLTVVGHGSNLLVLDGGIRGLVMRCEMTDIKREGNRIRAGSGVMLHSLAQEAASCGLDGLVFASGIPGTLGGAVTMNAGAYGGEMAQVVQSVRVLDMEGTEHVYRGGEMAFGYRRSRLQEEACVVTEVTCVLSEGCAEDLFKRMEELKQARMEKQPLNFPSAGSTFKRPEGAFAARLIDQCGLRGTCVGGAQVSEKHAGFLLNRGGTSEDFLNLMELVRKRVFEQTGFLLENEVRILGEP